MLTDDNPFNNKRVRINRNMYEKFSEFHDPIDLQVGVGIWDIKHEECYSEWLKEEINRFHFIIKEFIYEGYSQYFRKSIITSLQNDPFSTY